MITNQTIPVQVDSIKRMRGYQRTRCIYYRVEFLQSAEFFEPLNRPQSANLLATGPAWAVLTGPQDGQERFTSQESLDQSISAIHQDTALSLELAYIWIPNQAIEQAAVNSLIRAGDVFRLSPGYFSACIRFFLGSLDKRQWLSAGKTTGAILTSPAETEVFRDWRKSQIKLSRQRYHEPEYSTKRLRKK
jgi:hypothetical protein